MNRLREQQELFIRSVTEGIDENYALSIRENGLSGTQRLGIYRNGFYAGFCDALKGVFEVVHKLVGDDYFAHVAAKYVREYPSRTGNIHDFGEYFPEYLHSLPDLESLPYLPDVARLEWFYHAAFHSPVGEMLNIDKLSQVPASKYDRLHLWLSPACFLLQSDFPLLHIWQVNQNEYEGDEMVNLDEGGVSLAILRQGKQIVLHSLQPGAYSLFKFIAEGKTFADSCDAALKIDVSINVAEVLHDAVMNRMVVGFSVHE